MHYLDLDSAYVNDSLFFFVDIYFRMNGLKIVVYLSLYYFLYPTYYLN